ncbi:hypothetical protein CYMTET_6112, partial [Cymbomonas tetramitiformis]
MRHNFFLMKCSPRISVIVCLLLPRVSLGSGEDVAASSGISKEWGGWIEYDGRNGKGIAVHSSGYKVEGHWERGKPHGNAKATFPDGSIYDGQWNSGVMEGHGIFFSKANGSRYTGSWKDNAKHGVGTLTQQDGTYYYGDWANNMRNGLGNQRDAKGNNYT